MDKTTTTTKTAKYGTVIAKCTCSHSYQDSIYGLNKRVHNLGKLGEKRKCTVCGTVK